MNLEFLKLIPSLQELAGQASKVVDSVRDIIHTTVEFEPIKTGGFRIIVKPTEKTENKSTITEEDVSIL